MENENQHTIREPLLDSESSKTGFVSTGIGKAQDALKSLKSSLNSRCVECPLGACYGVLKGFKRNLFGFPSAHRVCIYCNKDVN